jgi:hypothetical protein
LVGEDGHIVRSEHVEMKELFIEEAGRTSRREYDSGTDRLDILFCSGKLALDLRLCKRTFVVNRKVIDHWIPNRSTELQIVKVNGTV